MPEALFMVLRLDSRGCRLGEPRGSAPLQTGALTQEDSAQLSSSPRRSTSGERFLVYIFFHVHGFHEIEQFVYLFSCPFT